MPYNKNVIAPIGMDLGSPGRAPAILLPKLF